MSISGCLLDVPYGFTAGLDAGSIHVEKQLAMHLYKQLRTAPRLMEHDLEFLDDIVDDGLNDFRENARWEFSLPTDTLDIKLGGRTMNYPTLQITRGVMRIEGYADFIPYLKSAENVL